MLPLKRSLVRFGARFENSSGCSGSERFRSHRQDRTEARFAAVHLFVGFLDAVDPWRYSISFSIDVQV